MTEFEGSAGDKVVWAYRYLLNREPESEDVVKMHLDLASSWRELRNNITNSLEYSTVNGVIDRWMVAPVFGDQRLLWVNMHDRFVSTACASDAYEPDNSEVFRRLVRPGEVVVDLGGNVGWFTMLANTLVGPTGHVYTFEAHPIIAGYLRRTIELNRQSANITLYEAAVWDAPGMTHLRWEVDARNPGGSYLVPDENSPLRVEGSAVRLMTVDSVGLKRVDFIKLDIEGAEPKALAGAATLLSTQRPTILTEVHGPQLEKVSGSSVEAYFKLLSDFGYRGFGVIGDLTGKLVEASDLAGTEMTNILFVHQDKVDYVLSRMWPAQ